jgi:hypothetical protein
VHFVVPEGIDDPARPSGGNTYDRHLRDELGALGWTVDEHTVASRSALADAVAQMPDDALVLIDGLIASPAQEVLVPQASRLRLVVLLHMPIGDRRERAMLAAAAAVVTTSEWARGRASGAQANVHVAAPGAETAELASGTGTGGSLLCVANVIPGKGHDVLIDALNRIEDLAWTCTCVGSLERDPAFAARLANDRVVFTGPRTGEALDRSYAAADLLVLATRGEAYGMGLAEGLAHGLPAIVSDVGGVSEALGHPGAGILLPPEDPAALAAALRTWLTDAQLRKSLRAAARERRATLRGWPETAAVVA